MGWVIKLMIDQTVSSIFFKEISVLLWKNMYSFANPYDDHIFGLSLWCRLDKGKDCYTC